MLHIIQIGVSVQIQIHDVFEMYVKLYLGLDCLGCAARIVQIQIHNVFEMYLKLYLGLGLGWAARIDSNTECI